ncbi:glyoxalase [Halobacteriales archaeon QH_2_65_14]|nr:MAG: glyoxalase [Halobacteriales archaeon QH_2_65_14]
MSPAADEPPSHGTPIRVDHAGIAVESIPEAEPVLFALGCEKRIEESVEGRFRWAQYDFGRDASRLELIAPEADEDIDAVVAALEAADIDVVEYTEFADWTEAFVSPTNPTGTLFQLMEYHDSYDEGRPPAEVLYVDGDRLDGG